MGKNSTVAATSKVSASAAPSSSSSTKSSILKSSFAPSRFQLRLFASVIQSFDSQQLRIHDTSSSRLRCVHQAKPNAKINCLDWGRYNRPKSGSQRSSQKTKSHANEDVVVAYGTGASEVCIFSPAEGKLVGTLVGGHERGIHDFKFSQHRDGEAWSIGADATLAQWDLKSDRVLRTISLPDIAITTLSYPSATKPDLVCASSTPFAVDLEASGTARIDPLDSMKNPIHTLFRSGVDGISISEFFLAADNDRYVNIYDLMQKRLVRTLIASASVQSADLFSTESDGVDNWDSQMLAILTNDGIVELFTRPFIPPTSRNGDIKLKRKGLTQKAAAKVRLVNPGEKSHVSIAAASLQGPELIVASIDGGLDISFQKIRWQDEGTGELLFEGMKEVPRVKTASNLNSASTNGVKDMSKSHVDESKTVVVGGVGDVNDQEYSQDKAMEILSSDDEEADEVDEGEQQTAVPEVDAESQEAESDEEMVDAKENVEDSEHQAAEGNEDAEGPSFGEMLASKTSQAIEIADAFEPESTALAKMDGSQLSLPAGMSLGTVLAQSLKTNDRNLLEACLHTTDLDVVRNTIQRLDSSLAGTLLSKLAERISSRPGRYGNLQTWVQQLCIAHGAAIASQPAVRNQVKILYRVLDQRAKSLSHLMLLKGKLDMLDAQLKFRKQLAAQRATMQHDQSNSGMIYIEGEADNWSSDDHDEALGSSGRQTAKRKPRKGLEDFGDQEDSDDEDMPLANGISGSESEEDEDDEYDVHPRSGTLVDEEAEEEEDSDEGGDVASSDEEEEDSEEEDDSEMDDFIDDGSIPEAEDDDDEEDEEEDDTPKKPATKRSRHR